MSDIDILQAQHLTTLISTSISHLSSDSSPSPDHVKAVLTITSAATQLAALVRPPAQVLLDYATGFTLSAALRLVVEANVPELVRELAVGDEGVAVEDIARLCGVEAAKLERILRLLATHHIFSERPPLPSLSSCTPATTTSARFAHTRLSAALDSGASLADILRPTTKEGEFGEGEEDVEAERRRWEKKYGAEGDGAGVAALVGILTDESMFNATALSEVLLSSASSSASISKVRTANHISKKIKIDHPSPSSTKPDAETETDAKHETEDDTENETDSPYAAAFSRARRLPHTTMFEWLNGALSTSTSASTDNAHTTANTNADEKANPNAHRLHRFGCAMRGMGGPGLVPSSALLTGFDFSSLAPGSVLIDVGGGVGAASLPILRACPGLRLVVQDVEGVVEVAGGCWEKHFPEALRDGRVTFCVQDFFEPQPDASSYHFPTFPKPSFDEASLGGSSSGTQKKKKTKVFLVRMIMHNWGDPQCLRILARLRDAASPSSSSSPASDEEEWETKLVLVDSVLMPACHGASNGTKEEEGGEGEGKEEVGAEVPEPLLANWGCANALAYKLDLIMLANHNARERTLPDFRSLLARAGWRVAEVHAASGSWMPQIVAVPAGVPVPVSGFI